MESVTSGTNVNSYDFSVTFFLICQLLQNLIYLDSRIDFRLPDFREQISLYNLSRQRNFLSFPFLSAVLSVFLWPSYGGMKIRWPWSYLVFLFCLAYTHPHSIFSRLITFASLGWISSMSFVSQKTASRDRHRVDMISPSIPQLSRIIWYFPTFKTLRSITFYS